MTKQQAENVKIKIFSKCIFIESQVNIRKYLPRTNQEKKRPSKISFKGYRKIQGYDFQEGKQ